MKFIKRNQLLRTRRMTAAILLGVVIAGLSGCSVFKSGAKDENLIEDKPVNQSAIDIQNQTIKDEIANLSKGSDTTRQVQDVNFAISELSYDIKKLGAEIEYLKSEVRELKNRSEMWDNPLKIYNKEIIMDNGTTVYGKIIYQDAKILKVETLVGYLVLDRDHIVRIVENMPEIAENVQPDPKATANPVSNSVPTATTSEPVALGSPGNAAAANCILDGNIKERNDSSGNRIFSGKIQNIGARRADFVKVDMIFRMNWSGSTKTLTTFVKGSFQTFQSGISSENSLLPGASGDFQLNISKSFGTFIGYTYKIEWEEYE